AAAMLLKSTATPATITARYAAIVGRAMIGTLAPIGTRSAFMAMTGRTFRAIRYRAVFGALKALLPLRTFGPIGLFHALDAFKLIARRADRSGTVYGWWGRSTRAWRRSSGRRCRFTGRTAIGGVEIWIGIS